MISGHAPILETLHLNNGTSRSSISSSDLDQGINRLLSDDWIEALIRANKIKNLRTLTLRIGKETF